ncbi:MAG: phosphate ABC transporter substrate-binding protein [Spirochaetales bacterium]|nr:phosphate ABC transporter substrate-binding protein [Spirochaetales bacterium]
MKTIFVLSILVLAVVFIAACGKSGTVQSVNYGGSTTVLPIMEGAIEQFQKLYPAVTVSYEAPGSSAGIKGVAEGTYKLGGSSRKLKDSEKESGIQATPIALDGLAVIVGGNVPVADLTIEKVAKIFAGETKNWKEVGGPDIPIVVINRDEASGTRGSFSELVLQHVLGKDAKFVETAIIVESNGDMTQKVGNTPNSIGYCGFGYIDAAKHAGAKEVSIAGMLPDIRNVYSDKYPLSRELYIVHKGDLPKDGVERDFVNFLLSKDGQKIVKDTGFIPLP